MSTHHWNTHWLIRHLLWRLSISEHGLLSCIHRSTHHGSTHLLIRRLHMLRLHLLLILHRCCCLHGIGVIWVHALSSWILLLHWNLTRSHRIGVSLVTLRWNSSLHSTWITRVNGSNGCSTVAMIMSVMMVTMMMTMMGFMVRVSSSRPYDTNNNTNAGDTANDWKQDIEENDCSNGLTIIIVVVVVAI